MPERVLFFLPYVHLAFVHLQSLTPPVAVSAQYAQTYCEISHLKAERADRLTNAANDKDLPAYKYFVDEGFACKLIYWELFNDEKVLAILNDVKQFPPDIFITNYFAIPLESGKWIKKAGIPTVMVLHNDNKYH